MQAAIVESLPAAILVGAEGFLLGFGGGWLGLSNFVDKPIWLAASLVSGSVCGAIAAAVLLRQAVRTADAEAATRAQDAVISADRAA